MKTLTTASLLRASVTRSSKHLMVSFESLTTPVAELKGNSTSVYNYHKPLRLIPKNLMRIGKPKLSLYDTCVQYFFTPAFNPGNKKKEFRSVSPKPGNEVIKAQKIRSRPESSLTNNKNRVIRNSRESRGNKHQEKSPEDELMDRLYYSKKYKVVDQKSKDKRGIETNGNNFAVKK